MQPLNEIILLTAQQKEKCWFSKTWINQGHIPLAKHAQWFPPFLLWLMISCLATYIVLSSLLQCQFLPHLPVVHCSPGMEQPPVMHSVFL